MINYKVFHSGYELFPFLYIEFSEPVVNKISAVELCNVCSSNGWYDAINFNINMKRGKIATVPGHMIKDGTRCGNLQASPGFFSSCECKRIICKSPMSNVESVTIQRIKHDRRGIFSQGSIKDQASSWELKYAKPIRTFLLIKEVKFY